MRFLVLPGFAVRLMVSGFCREVFGFAVRFLVLPGFAVRFLVLP